MKMNNTEIVEKGIRIYEVTFEANFCVAATSKDEAVRLSREQKYEIMQDFDFSRANLTPSETWGIKVGDKEYDLHIEEETSIPYGLEVGDKTIKQIREAWQEHESIRPITAQELEALGQQRLDNI